MNLENLEFLVYDLMQSRHNAWIPPSNIWYTMTDNFPEVTQKMIEDSCESLVKKNLAERTYGLSSGHAYRRTRVWRALDLPKRDRYGNLGEEDNE
jgi:hypothetical protein